MVAEYSKKSELPDEVFLLEELAELTQQITKQLRGKGDHGHTTEEIADVINSILIYCFYKGYNIDHIFDIIDAKLDRQICRYERGDEK